MRPPLARLVVTVIALAGPLPRATAADPAPSRASVDRDNMAAADRGTMADSLRDDTASFPVELGTFATTLIGSTDARTHNIRLAAEALDGVVLEPGAELSFNDRVGPRTLQRGFLVAPVILREERQLQLGGGICQVASTLFDA